MKIQDKNQILNLNSYLRNIKSKESLEAVKNKEKLKKEKVAGEKEFEVNLSSRAKDIQKIRKALENVPDIRTEKVNSLKKMIKEGKYNISADKVAESILKESVLDEIL
ncbi:MAG: flagellar biosynthesis anti-sigma factor FlgM [Thermodesulfobacteriota bacterium]|nr:flagellar biosynthesis anti-sigma factor FlgM [Thermodesulfobacteriota bacterium]